MILENNWIYLMGTITSKLHANFCGNSLVLYNFFIAKCSFLTHFSSPFSTIVYILKCFLKKNCIVMSGLSTKVSAWSVRNITKVKWWKFVQNCWNYVHSRKKTYSVLKKNSMSSPEYTSILILIKQQIIHSKHTYNIPWAYFIDNM